MTFDTNLAIENQELKEKIKKLDKTIHTLDRDLQWLILIFQDIEGTISKFLRMEKFNFHNLVTCINIIKGSIDHFNHWLDNRDDSLINVEKYCLNCKKCPDITMSYHNNPNYDAKIPYEKIKKCLPERFKHYGPGSPCGETDILIDFKENKCWGDGSEDIKDCENFILRR